MDYTIQLMEGSEIIQVIPTGVWERSVDTTMGMEIMKKSVEWKVNRVLIDMRELQFTLPVIEIFQRAKDLSDQRREIRPFSSRVALVYSPKDRKVEEDFIFFENTARNRGLPYRTFQKMEEALEWLKS